MALPLTARQGSTPSHSPAALPGSAPLRPLKKIKRTSFPEWEDGPSAKRTSITPVAIPTPGNAHSAPSRATQDAQNKWAKEQQQAAETVAPAAEESGSEYFTSDSPASDDGSYRESETKAIRKKELQNRRQSQWGTTLPFIPSEPSSASEDESSSDHSSVTPARVMSASEGLVLSDVQKSLSRNSQQTASARPNAVQEGETPNNRRHHLTPNELEAKIREDSLRAGSNKGWGEETEGSDPLLERQVGPNGELYATKDGRLYCVLVLPHGERVNTGACPIPTNYRLLNNSSNPFVCPVRDCRKIGASASFLSGHFSAVHYKSTFNDNLDGTISKVGSYNRGPNSTSPGIVVSQGPPPPDIDPPAFPELSSSSKSKATSKRRKSSTTYTDGRQRLPVSNSPVPLPIAARIEYPYAEPTKYLLSFLSPKQELWKRLDIQYLSRYPRKRNLPQAWISHYLKGYLCPSTYAISLAYLVGEEVTDDSEKCTAPIMATARLSDHCIRLPADMPDHACAEFSKTKTCVGCRYWCFIQRRRNHCSWSSDSQLDSVSEAGTDSMDLDRSSVGIDSVKEPSPAPRPVQVETAAQTRRLQNLGSNQQAGSGLRYSTTVSGRHASEPSLAQLEMEDWEFAPGRLLNKKEPAQNVAFSNSYLTSREPVAVSEDISFNVTILSSGTTVHFDVENSKLRTCSVAAGKVKVKVGETEFKIGPHGMFKVMPGESCVVENRHYMDAYIHCTTIDNYELAA